MTQDLWFIFIFFRIDYCMVYVTCSSAMLWGAGKSSRCAQWKMSVNRPIRPHSFATKPRRLFQLLYVQQWRANITEVSCRTTFQR
jgi:hypothetical protein